MIAVLSRGGPPDATRALRALAAVPYPAPDVAWRRVGNALIGIANRPDFVDATLSSDGAIVAGLSGELENASELHDELIARGTSPASAAPADLVVAAFRAFGASAPARMRGAIAGVVTDGNTLWCFRDHVGFRPLFYRDDAQAFVAASEPRQVAVAADLREEPDLEVLERILFGDMPSDMPAALRGVSRLAQATTLIVGHGRTSSSHVYWRPLDHLETARPSERDVGERFLALLEQASVRSLSGKDVILLSGGLDSPAIAAYAAPEFTRRTGRPMGALSAVFPDLPAVDERRYIEIVAARYGMELHTFRPDARALDDVEAWARRFASPVAILSIPEVSAAYMRARALGYENVITGEFAEFTYGSPKHALQHLITRGRFATAAALVRSEFRRGRNIRSLAIQVAATFVPGRFANWYIHRRGYDVPERIPEWLDAAKVDAIPFRSDLIHSPRERWRQLQLGGTEGATLMAEADCTVATMAGVRVRRPFADIDLWNFFLSLPVERRFPELRYKALGLRHLRGVLPDEIMDRKGKTAFDAHVLSQVDYVTLKRLLVAPRYRMPGVDYARLAERIERQDFKRFDWFWARDLAWIHAFMRAW
jgi:asparagine synthase (glutamine-hydrolysing)